MSKFISTIFIFFLAISISHSDTITIQSTTSTRDSGLYKYLLPKYPNFNDVQIKLIAVGTGQAIINARNCDGNILIVHDKEREDKFMANGFGSSRFNIMYNDFVIVGPKKDAADIKSAESVLEVFTKIYTKKHIFVSRSDSSGTHSAEMKIWDNIGLDPTTSSGKWYLESGQGMGPSLNIAISLNGYIFSDRSTWLRFNNKRDHIILYSNPVELRNSYSMILVNHDRCNNLDLKPARDLYNWLKSDEAASLINEYKVSNQQVFYIQ
ncbi:MAG: substrate-binding domain-containing protein [Pseudomonadota bacterium]|nr:substrate-binding domain-containing protein [Pseudomonadota bacterium]